MGTSNFVLGEPDKMHGGNLLRTSIPSKWSRNTSYFGRAIREDCGILPFLILVNFGVNIQCN